jgi:integrase
MSGKIQKGYVWRVKRSWYGRWYQDEFDEDGNTVRVQHSEWLCEYSDVYRSKKDVQKLLADKLRPINDDRAAPEGTLTVAKYFEKFFLPYAERELKPSTSNGYKSIWRMYINSRVGRITLRNFRCVDANNILATIHREHGLSRKSLRLCKGLLSTVFMHAKRNGVIDGLNPISDAGIPKKATAAGKTHAYTVEEVTLMLSALEGVARAAVALMYFCGLRPGEARGAKWDDYDEDKRKLQVARSVWRKHETVPKTEESVAPVPVCEALRKILVELPRASEYILATPSGRPMDLHNLAARVIAPALKLCSLCRELEAEHPNDHEFKRLPEWRGFYALRRGIGTAPADVDSAVAAKSVLRHSNISTTTAHYVKSVDAAALRAMDKIDMLFDNGNVSGRPN